MKLVLMILGGIVVIILIYLIFVNKASAKPSGASTNKINTRNSDVQSGIDRIMTSDAWADFRDNLKRLKVGGAHGVPATISDAKQYVFSISLKREANGWSPITDPTPIGSYNLYNYPNIELYSVPDGTTTSGLERDNSKGNLFGGLFGGTHNPTETPSTGLSSFFKLFFPI